MATQICLVSVLILDRSFLLLLPLPGIDLRSWALNGFLSFLRSRTFYSCSSNGFFPVSLGQEVSNVSPRGRWVLPLCLPKQWIFTCALWVGGFGALPSVHRRDGSGKGVGPCPSFPGSCPAPSISLASTLAGFLSCSKRTRKPTLGL